MGGGEGGGGSTEFHLKDPPPHLKDPLPKHCVLKILGLTAPGRGKFWGFERKILRNRFKNRYFQRHSLLEYAKNFRLRRAVNQEAQNV